MSAPLVLIHGFTGGPESWDDVITRLSPSRKAFRETLLGHGSPELDTADTFEREVDRIAANLVARGLGAIHVVGYSLGARIALGLLTAHPSLVERATLIGVHPGIANEEERREREAADEIWARLVETRGTAVFVDAWEAQPIIAPQSALAVEVRERQRLLRERHRTEGLALALRTLGLAKMPNYRPRLREIAVPVHLVVGESDAKFRALAESMLAAMQHATLEVVPGAGHNLVVEQPSVVAAAVSSTSDNRHLEARSS